MNIIHRIEDEPERTTRWTQPRQAYLELLEAGPTRICGSAGADAMRHGWVDWVRDGSGMLILGDRRYCLTQLGREKLASWRAEGHRVCGVPPGVDRRP